MFLLNIFHFTMRVNIILFSTNNNILYIHKNIEIYEEHDILISNLTIKNIGNSLWLIIRVKRIELKHFRKIISNTT